MKPDKILLDHGSGGKISHRLTTGVLLPVFDNPILAQLNGGVWYAHRAVLMNQKSEGIIFINVSRI